MPHCCGDVDSPGGALQKNWTRIHLTRYSAGHSPRSSLSSVLVAKSKIRTEPSSEHVAIFLSVGAKLLLWA